MTSVFSFIVKPVGERYNNKVKIDGKDLIINTKIESFKSVNNLAEVVSIPLAYSTDIKVGDLVVIHHNVFRRFYDIRGKQKNSRAFFMDNLYFCDIDQIYLYKNDNKWKAFGDRCFIKPLKNNDNLRLNKEQSLIGILKYGNSSLEALKINEGDLVGYTPFGEFDFIIEGQRLYCMKSNDIVIKYEYKGDEAEYNPSWSKSSRGIN
jgi:co-chaperonin GroES (HSP10)